MSESDPPSPDLTLVGQSLMSRPSWDLGRGARTRADTTKHLRPRDVNLPTPRDRERRGVVVRAALAQLPAAQRDVVIAVYFRGCSQSRVAVEFGLPVSTVQRRLFLGLCQLGTVVDESLTEDLQ